MIDTHIARDLLPLVNDPEQLKSLLDYVEYRIKYMSRTLEVSTDLHEILRAQGAIKELRRFENLREEAIADSKNKV